MEALLLMLFEKLVLPWLLEELVKSGIITNLEASAITDLEGFMSWVKTLKTYSAPEDFPNPPPNPTPNNLSPSQEQDDAYPRPRS